MTYGKKQTNASLGFAGHRMHRGGEKQTRCEHVNTERARASSLCATVKKLNL